MIPARPDTPVIYVQCDWNESIRNVKGEAWISCKFRDEPSFHGKIKSKGLTKEGIPSLTISEGFSIRVLSASAIHVKHDDSGHSCTFEAPCGIFSTIHNKSVLSLDTTPGGLGVSVCADNRLLMWDSRQGQMRRTFTSHVGDVYCCRFFPSGLVVLSGGADMQLKIWSAETGQCPVTLIGHTAAITDVAFVERGRNIISTSKDGTAKLWDCGESRFLGNVLEVGVTINSCSLGVANNRMELGEPQEAPSEREVGTEDKVLLVGCEDGSVHCVAVRSRRVLFTIHLGSPVNCVKFLSTEQFAVGTQNGQVLCYHLQAPEQPYISWFESNSAVLSFVPLELSGLFVGRADGSCTYHCFAEEASRSEVQFTGPDFDPVYDVSFDGTYIFTACRDATIRKYDVSRMLTNLSKLS